MLVNCQTKSNTGLFPLSSSEFPAEMALQGKPRSLLFSIICFATFQEHVCFFEKIVLIHHVLLYLKTKTIFVLSSQMLNEAIDCYCMGELYTFMNSLSYSTMLYFMFQKVVAKNTSRS